MNSFISRAKKNSAYKAKAAAATASTVVLPGQPIASTKAPPSLSDFLHQRDYTGALTLLSFQRSQPDLDPLQDEGLLAWQAYSSFHLGDYKKALDAYVQLGERAEKPLKGKEEHKSDDSNDDEADDSAPTKPTAAPSQPRPAPEQWRLYAACCHFYLGDYVAADALLTSLPPSPLSARLQLHLALKLADEPRVVKWTAKLTSSTADQLSLACLHYLRNHYQEATDVYKKLLLEFRDYTALQVYVAMCYYKLDYYDVSLEILGPYLAAHADSATAMNLKACNHYKLYDGKAAEAELKPILDSLHSSSPSSTIEHDLLRHNLVVFRNGDNALPTLTPLIDLIPEARLNLAIYHLRNHHIAEADELMRALEPTTPQEYILKGVVNSAVGQLNDSRNHLKAAQEYFQLVGASASECDTIPGRQCMASCFFLLKQFDDVLIYLNSIRQYSASDSIFLFNFGIALAATEQFQEALDALVGVSDVTVKVSYTYISWLARCYIMTGQPKAAWELYLKMDSNNDSFSLLQLIANDCYKIGSFFYAAKAFDVLERLDPTEGYWEGKRGACVGVLQAVLGKKERKEVMRDVVSMLKGNAGQGDAVTTQVDQMVRVMRKWCLDNGVVV